MPHDHPPDPGPLSFGAGVEIAGAQIAPDFGLFIRQCVQRALERHGATYRCVGASTRPRALQRTRLMPPILHVKKTTHSVNPYRIGLLYPDGGFQPLAYFTFPRKRDALPFLRRLEALRLDWQIPPTQWPEAHRQAAEALIKDTQDWQAFQALRARGVVAPGRRGR